jgi:hypothetical protein
MRPGLGGGAPPKAAASFSGPRTTRILEGNVDVVGVLGKTFIELCGLRVIFAWEDEGGEVILIDADEVDDALE